MENRIKRIFGAAVIIALLVTLSAMAPARALQGGRCNTCGSRDTVAVCEQMGTARVQETEGETILYRYYNRLCAECGLVTRHIGAHKCENLDGTICKFR